MACSATVKEKEASQRDIEKGEAVKAGELELGEPIDFFQLKKLPFISTTSGVLSQTESKDFCTPTDHQFFGQYFLLDRADEQSEILGKLIVSVPKRVKIWTYENDYESFVQLELESNKVSLWNKIRVGISDTELMNFIEPYFSYKAGAYVYSWLGGYALAAEMEGTAVKKLIVTKICN
ncbi:MAG: hypothetical protein R2809_08200 [Flavobacteriales bacterium]